MRVSDGRKSELAEQIVLKRLMLLLGFSFFSFFYVMRRQNVICCCSSPDGAVIKTQTEEEEGGVRWWKDISGLLRRWFQFFRGWSVCVEQVSHKLCSLEKNEIQILWVIWRRGVVGGRSFDVAERRLCCLATRFVNVCLRLSCLLPLYFQDWIKKWISASETLSLGTRQGFFICTAPFIPKTNQTQRALHKTRRFTVRAGHGDRDDKFQIKKGNEK